MKRYDWVNSESHDSATTADHDVLHTQQSIKCSFQPHATCVTHAPQGFMQGTQRTQEVANDMAETCHVIWLANCKLEHVLFLCIKPCIVCIACVACVMLAQNLAFLA